MSEIHFKILLGPHEVNVTSTQGGPPDYQTRLRAEANGGYMELGYNFDPDKPPGETVSDEVVAMVEHFALIVVMVNRRLNELDGGAFISQEAEIDAALDQIFNDGDAD